jgi:hypothetical protein
MYPPDTSNTATIEVRCCNSIEQCAVSTFRIVPVDTEPVDNLSGLDKTFIIQYDSIASMGEGLSYAVTSL